MKDRKDPVEQSFRRGFTWSCRKHGLSYEHVIRAVYERAAKRWSPGYVIDGGAHKGLHTLPLAKLDAVETVLAFEPSEEVHEVLVGRIASSGLGPKIRLHKAALQEDPARTSISFHVSPTHPGRSGINPILRRNPDTEYDAPAEVAATTIDQVTDGLAGGCRFVKLDLEGGEFNALKGGEAMLRRDRPMMVFENGLHAPAIGGYERQAFLDYLESVGMAMVTAFGDVVGAPERMKDFWYAWACAKEDRPFVRRTVRHEAGRVFKAFRDENPVRGAATGLGFVTK